MSYNQVRPNRSSETQYRKTERLASFNQQRNSTGGFAKGTVAGPVPSPSINSSPLPSNDSFKKSNIAHEGKSRLTTPPVSSSLPPQNGVRVQPQSQGASDAPVVRGSSNPTESSSSSSSSRRSNRAVHKPPYYQSTTLSSDGNEPKTPPKVPGDVSKAFAFQFGSLSPGFMNGMQIPARTSSAPPSLDEQKRAQAPHDCLTVPNLPSPVPKHQEPNKDVHQSIDNEAHQTPKETRDVQVLSAPAASQAQKSPVAPVGRTSMQTLYKPLQVSSVQFGGPNLHIQSHNVPASSLQMPMPIPMQMGNALPMQHQVFVPGLQLHPVPHHGITHQAQSLSFTTPTGAQLPPQLVHMGMGLNPQYPQQQGGKFGGPHKIPVKITHPDTHEELRLDKRVDSGSSFLRSHPNMPPQSQPVPSVTLSRPVNYFHSSYDTGPVVFPPSSLPLSSNQMTPNSQVPRLSYPVSQGFQGVALVNPSPHNLATQARPGASAHGFINSSHSSNACDPQNEMYASAPSAATKVTVKLATVIEKDESPKPSRPTREISTPLHQKNLETGSASSSQELKPGNESVVSKSLTEETTPTTVATACTDSLSLENVPVVASTEIREGEMLSRSNSVKDLHEQPGKKGQTHPLPVVIGQSTSHSHVSDPDVSSTSLASVAVDTKEPPAGAQPGIDSSASKASESSADGVEGSAQILSETSGPFLQGEELKCDTRGTEVEGDKRSSEKHMEGSKCGEVFLEPNSSKSAEFANDIEGKSNLNMGAVNDMVASIGTERDNVDGATGFFPGTERIADVMSTPVFVVSHPTVLQSSSIPPDLSETILDVEGEESAGCDLTCLPVTVSKDKFPLESNMTRSTTHRGKKKRKEILRQADAVGTSSDLYMAYKGPGEKKEMEMHSRSTKGVSAVANPNQTTANGLQADAVATEEVEQSKAEIEDWEDVADVSTSKLKTPYEAENVQRGSAPDIKDGYGSMDNKYSRDFLLKFADQYTGLPERFEVSSDIADALMSMNMDALHADRDSHPTPGRVVDRQGSGSRLDPRACSVVVDDRWNNSPGSLGSGRDPRFYRGYGDVGFLPGQGGNSGVLRNPRSPAPIISRGMQSTGPLGGMGRNSLDVERWQRATSYLQKGLIPSPQNPLQVMHRAGKKYEVGRVMDVEEAKQRRLKAILNKLTPQNFEKLFEQVKEVNIDNAVTLTGVISQIFDKALMEPTFCEMYADFCRCLAGELPDFMENNEKITFKRLLLNKCQEEFERGEREEEEANKVEEGEVKQTEGEREEKRLKVRRRMLGNIRLIGELYKKRMLTEKIMHECIKKLLGYNQDYDEENIEALCKLMSTIGETFDHPKTKVHMDAYFERMTILSNNTKLSSRVRFMLKDAIDLRKNKWQQRRKIEGPKKIEEVHRDAAQERQTLASRLARGPSFNSSARKGPSDFGPRVGSLLSSPNPQMSSFRGLHQARGFGTQNVRFEEGLPYEARTLSVNLPQRSFGDESITLGPRGGLGRGMSIRGPPAMSSTPVSDISSAAGDSRRMATGLNGFCPDRFAAPAAYGSSIFQEPGISNGKEDMRNPDRSSDRSLGASPPMQEQESSSAQNVPSEKVWPEERLRDMSMAAIKEFYSARDEKEVGLCIKDLNSPSFYPTMISLWVIDSFERKDVERNLLAKLISSLVKSPDSILSQEQLTKGFEYVLASLEDSVKDAPKAAESLGRIFGKAIAEKVVSLGEIGQLIHEGGEEPGSLLECGLAGDVLGSALEMIKSEAGETVLKEILQSSGLRLQDFRCTGPNKSRILENYI